MESHHFTWSSKDAVGAGGHPDMALNTKTRECSLTKEEGKGYGFFLRIEQDEPGHLVRSVEKGSIADKAGLKDGDRVMKVNGVFVDDTEHVKVVEMIQASGKSVALTVLDEVSYLNSKKNTKDLPESKAPSEEKESPKPRICYLAKGKSSFGFSLKTQKSSEGFYLESLAADGVAAKAGVKQGDRIIEVNGKNIENGSYNELVTQIKESGDSVVFLVADKETDDYFLQQKKKISAEEATLHLLPTPPRIVELDKGADGYGFYLRQEKNRKGHFVVEIEQKSPAHKADLKEYDRIVAVNGESVESFDHEQVVEAIRKGGNKTTLLISNKVTDEIYAKAGISPFLYLKTSKTPKPVKTETPKPVETPAAKPSPAPVPVQPTVIASPPDPKHKPRLCRLEKGGSGFGFNLNAIKDVPGQYIKQVSKGGPADVAGIKEDDILLEVNGVNVEKNAYEDVIMKIKEAGAKVTLLVASQEAYDYFKAKKIPITSSMADPLPETNGPSSLIANQKTPPSKAKPAPEPVTMDIQKTPPSKARAAPEPEEKDIQKTPPSKARAAPEPEETVRTDNQKTPPSKAQEAPAPVEMETKTPEEKPPKDEDDTVL
ncbi:Na(+)/H(+) exchange regulatory cofactor NHE-RF3-like isoform X3 [Hyla sarda]|nr:Na(+)/H(+) exchange regulatory cofactor NHE-RF3-like isoform X3 [Hyla sarda]XP_056415758.1 Na(+)/H(+) exchange regulatory cofactor NHE-RF3-like isoform X3 [Hyla sarda]